MDVPSRRDYLSRWAVGKIENVISCALLMNSNHKAEAMSSLGELLKQFRSSRSDENDSTQNTSRLIVISYFPVFVIFVKKGQRRSRLL